MPTERKGEEAPTCRIPQQQPSKGREDGWKNGVLLRDVKLIRERWVRWFHTLFNATSPRLNPNIAEGLDQWPENMPLGVQLTMQEPTDAIHSLANGKDVGPDGVSVELFNINLNGDPALRRRLLDIAVRI